MTRLVKGAAPRLLGTQTIVFQRCLFSASLVRVTAKQGPCTHAHMKTYREMRILLKSRMHTNLLGKTHTPVCLMRKQLFAFQVETKTMSR